MTRTNSKKSFLITVFALLLLLVLQACGGNNSGPASSSAPEGSEQAESPQVKAPSALRVGYIGNNKLNFPGGAEGWGFYKGQITEAFKELGVEEITFVGFTGGPDLNESLIAGRVDVGIYGDTPAITSHAKGAPTKLIGQPSSSIIIYLIGKKDGPQTVADLKDQQVATQKGSVLHRFTAGILKQEGVAESANLIQLNASDVEAALARGDIAAGSLNGGTALAVLDKGYPLLAKSSDSPSLSGSLATVVTESYLKKFPELPRIWNELREASLADLKTKPEEYYQYLSDLTGQPLEIVKKTDPIENISGSAFTELSLQQLEEVKQFLLDEQLITDNFSVEDWIAR